MSEKRKTFVVTTLKGTREIQSISREYAWRAAIARGWRPIEIKEKRKKKVA